MKQGFLWYDSDPRKTFGAKLEEAAAHYRVKFGIDPVLCYINPNHITEATSGGKLKVVGAAAVLPNHVWLEIEEK